MDMSLHTKYRPATFDQVIGQDAVVKSIAGIIAKKTSHAFLLTGPSGTGKTTIARIIAAELGCDPRNIIEIDAATHTGIDAWRAICDGLRYAPLGGGNAVKFVVVDECHALSKASWQSLLKDIEEPSAHVYWGLCTTESSKVPETIKTRCSCYELAPVKTDTIHDLIDLVCKREKGGPSEEIRALIARSAMGSPRKALTSLAACWEAEDVNEAAILLRTAGESEDVINICRGLIKGDLTWEKAAAIFNEIKGENPESLRLTTQAYMSKVLLGCKSKGQAMKAVRFLEAFARPYPPGTTDIAPYILDVCSLILVPTPE